MGLCSMCEAIPADLFHPSPQSWLRRLVHHPSWNSLELSAKGGCNVCSFIYETIYDIRHVKEYPCDDRGGPPIAYVYHGLPENVAVKDGDQTYISILWNRVSNKTERSKGGEKKWFDPKMCYKIGHRGMDHAFDLEFSDDVASSLFYSRSDKVFDILNFWLHECTMSHDDCNIRYDSLFKPTRLIDVGSHNVSPRLVITKDSDADFSRYLTLSHRWGESMPEIATTKTTNISKYSTRLPVRNLPRTFRDAITATRKLNFRYLWIDSLCIIQDSLEDWENKSALMGKVYSHCFCMLAAAASVDSDGGLFPSRGELPILPTIAAENGDSLLVVLKKSYTYSYTDSYSDSRWNGLFLDSKLNTRGWTLQERELSPRILYFTKNTMLFECKEARAGAVDTSNETDEASKRAFIPKKSTTLEFSPKVRRALDPISLKLYDEISFPTHRKVQYGFWMDLVEGYSTRQLSKKSDTFPGLSGLASEFSFLLDDQYVAGLWRNDLLRGLCWKWVAESSMNGQMLHSKSKASSIPELGLRASSYKPSWSWAKVNAPISYDGVRSSRIRMVEQESSENPQILNVNTVPEGKDPNGTLISATIHLRAQLIPVKVNRIGNININGDTSTVAWDFNHKAPDYVKLLSLGETQLALVLAPTDNGNEYMRIGICHIPNSKWFKSISFEECFLV